jgi:hypothetical protein
MPKGVVMALKPRKVPSIGRLKPIGPENRDVRLTSIRARQAAFPVTANAS